MAGATKDAVSSVLSGARNLLPFSPAKEGPFSGKGWTTYSGEAMMAGLAQGIRKGADLPSMAMNGVLQQTNNNIGGTSIYGNINISNRQDANYLLSKLDRNNQLTGMGMSIQ
jgi:hypothetical protein